MRPERLRSIIRTALDEGAVQVEIELKTGETVKVNFAAEKVKTNPADLVDMSE